MTITLDHDNHHGHRERSNIVVSGTSSRPDAPWAAPSRSASSRRRHPRLGRLVRTTVVAVALILVAATGRIIGLPLVAAIILALVVGLVIRRSLLRRRERRITIPKALALAAMMLGLVATAWSYTGALTDPGSAPVADRTANWMRDHHMNIIVDTIEQRLYSGNTSTGVVDRASLPNTPTAAPVSAAALPTAAASSSPPRTPSIKAPAVNPSTTAAGSTTTTAPPDRKPPTAGPLIDATLLGEGHWTPNPREVNGAPVSYTTFVRPDPDDRGVVAAAVVLEPSATKLVYVPGTKQPGGSGWLWKSGIPNAQRPDLVAAFNGGWKQRDKPGGAYTEGQTAAPLIDGKGSLVIYSDGHNDIGAWGSDVTMTPDVVSVRQNLDLIVTRGVAVDGLATGGTGNWGSTKYQLQHTRRSGIGITASGAVVYVAGSNMTTATIAHALVQVGAIRAMELDIHSQHPTFNFFTPAPGTHDGVKGQKLRLGDEADPAIVHRAHGRQRSDIVPLPTFRAADLER